MTKLLKILEEKIENAERMHEYYSEQLKSYESKIDTLKDILYDCKTIQEEGEESEEGEK